MSGMRDIGAAVPAEFRSVDYILTDVDDTLTTNGRLPGATLDALARLDSVGLKIIPVTGASAGWCNMMMHMWPIDAVVAENGGLYFYRDEDREVVARYWSAETGLRQHLRQLSHSLAGMFPDLRMADDFPYRETCVAFRRMGTKKDMAVVEHVRRSGGWATLNSLWILCGVGAYDKLSMSRKLFAEVYGREIGHVKNAVVYVGDSQNDEPMFQFFPKSVGVSTVVRHPLQHWPRWICRGGGGDGFVEVAEAVIASRSGMET